MALLLAGIPAALLALWALHRLFRAIHDEGLRFLRRHLNPLFYAQHSPRQPFDALKAAGTGGSVHPVQAAHKILCDMAAVQDQQDQKMIPQIAHSKRTSGTVLWLHNPLSPVRAQRGNHFMELSGRHPRH